MGHSMENKALTLFCLFAANNRNKELAAISKSII